MLEVRGNPPDLLAVGFGFRRLDMCGPCTKGASASSSENASFARLSFATWSAEGAELPQCATRDRAAKMEHVVENLFGFFVSPLGPDFERTVYNALQRLWPGFVSAQPLHGATVGTQINNLAQSAKTPWGLLGAI